MKNFLIFVSSAFVSTLIFGLTTSSAAELKVYYSEPIGAGEKVYHFTSCEKQPSYAPVRCAEDTASISQKQCKPGGKLSEGTPIKGCLTGSNIGNTAYPEAKADAFDRGECKDDELKQGYVYAPEFAVLDDKGTVRGTFVNGKETADASDSMAKKAHSDVKDVKPLHRTSLCATWDVPVKGGDAQPQGNLTGKIKTFYDTAHTKSQSVIDAGCNNDNSQANLGSFTKSTPFDKEPTVSCSIVERITGESGTDIFGQYVSALYRWAAGIVGIIAVLTMVASGVQISTAGGDSAVIDQAKNRIMKSIIGLAILFLSGLILYTINPGFFTG